MESAAPPAGRRRIAKGWWSVLGALIAVAACASWVIAHPRTAPPSNPYGLPAIPSGTPAAAFGLPGLSGGRVLSTARQDQPMVINFFASWCVNCAGELKTFAAAARDTRGMIHFVGIDTNDPNHGAARAMIKRSGVGYPIGVDASQHTAYSYQVIALPTTVFVDRAGRVIGEAFGAQSPAKLAAWVSRLERT